MTAAEDENEVFHICIFHMFHVHCTHSLARCCRIMSILLSRCVYIKSLNISPRLMTF